MRIAFLVAVLAAVASVAGSGQAPGEGAAPRKGDPQRGQYLAEHVAMCVECHSERDHLGQIIPDRKYMGGSIPTGPAWAHDWAVRAPRNRGLPGYDDAAALRLLTHGAIARDGRQLSPPMPRFRMTREDAADVIAFLRSLP